MNLEPTEHVILVFLGEKKLWHCPAADKPVLYSSSSSPHPVSCQENSLGTPTGLHQIVEKYGDNEPPGTVFIGRNSQGHHYSDRDDAGPEQKALVTTRILRLAGMEQGHNQGPGHDSYDRYIYIHGTNHPEKFPNNHSAGCIHLRDDDLITLYDAVNIGTHVWIQM